MWKVPTANDIKLVLAQDEIDKLEKINATNPTILDQTIKLVSSFVRGALKGNGVKLATLPYSIPESYMLIFLQLLRKQLWTRFPNSENIALDELRQKEAEQAMELLKKMSIDVDEIQPEYDPENPENPDYKADIVQGSIRVPWLRFPQPPYGDEFNKLINSKEVTF